MIKLPLYLLDFRYISANQFCSIIDQDHCYFRYGLASYMVPCCLEIITREDYDKSRHSGTSDEIVKHDFCPVTPDEAHKLWQSRNSG